jgi:hypothetical protein
VSLMSDGSTLQSRSGTLVSLLVDMCGMALHWLAAAPTASEIGRLGAWRRDRQKQRSRPKCLVPDRLYLAELRPRLRLHGSAAGPALDG